MNRNNRVKSLAIFPLTAVLFGGSLDAQAMVSAPAAQRHADALAAISKRHLNAYDAFATSTGNGWWERLNDADKTYLRQLYDAYEDTLSEDSKLSESDSPLREPLTLTDKLDGLETRGLFSTRVVTLQDADATAYHDRFVEYAANGDGGGTGLHAHEQTFLNEAVRHWKTTGVVRKDPTNAGNNKNAGLDSFPEQHDAWLTQLWAEINQAPEYAVSHIERAQVANQPRLQALATQTHDVARAFSDTLAFGGQKSWGVFGRVAASSLWGTGRLGASYSTTLGRNFLGLGAALGGGKSLGVIASIGTGRTVATVRTNSLNGAAVTNRSKIERENTFWSLTPQISSTWRFEPSGNAGVTQATSVLYLGVAHLKHDVRSRLVQQAQSDSHPKVEIPVKVNGTSHTNSVLIGGNLEITAMLNKRWSSAFGGGALYAREKTPGFEMTGRFPQRRGMGRTQTAMITRSVMTDPHVAQLAQLRARLQLRREFDHLKLPLLDDTLHLYGELNGAFSFLKQGASSASGAGNGVKIGLMSGAKTMDVGVALDWPDTGARQTSVYFDLNTTF